MDWARLHAVIIILAINFVTSQSIDCPAIYQRYSDDHSYCKSQNLSCNILKKYPSDSDKSEILRLHNSFRSVIATQNANGLPTAANILQMEWDDELATTAQRYAEQCIYAHDKPNQRRVRNFGVGQNIAIQRITGQNVSPPQPDWVFAVGDWFEEIVYFSRSMICPFSQPSGNTAEYRHFTQLVWASSFRLGCGYVMYKHGLTYIRLYICNYGPSGNIYGGCVYKQGPACTQCPLNTCCGDQCADGLTYPGLCKRNSNQPPVAPLNVPTIFYCNFQNPSAEDCLINTYGDNSWYIIPALGGYYLETVLNPGQNGTIVFSKQIKPSSSASKFCVTLQYRKGPNLAKNPQNNKGNEVFIIPSLNHYTLTQPLPSYDGEAREQFSTFNLTLQWPQSTTMKVSFAVPPGATPQFMDIDAIIATEGQCHNT